MKKLILLLLFIPLVFSCSSDEEGGMQLTIVNNFDLWKITNVSLQDYNFSDLNINGGSSRTFTLVNGIPSGSSDIGISIGYRCSNRSMNLSVRADFNDGKTTTITINPTPDNTVDAILQDCYNYEFIVSD
jgi:hypothetical protein